jgi:CRISPR/Cas system-associated exonuclease Cas4 (RecB family)
MFGDNNYLILDWKSGKESLDSYGITDQLRVYALKMLLKQRNTQLGERHIDVYEVYLPSLHEKTGTIQQEDVDHIIAKILDDVEYQKQFIVDQDSEKNEPLSHTAFTRTTSEKKCAGCTFREVCQKLKEQES